MCQPKIRHTAEQRYVNSNGFAEKQRGGPTRVNSMELPCSGTGRQSRRRNATIEIHLARASVPAAVLERTTAADNCHNFRTVRSSFLACSPSTAHDIREARDDCRGNTSTRVRAMDSAFRCAELRQLRRCAHRRCGRRRCSWLQWLLKCWGRPPINALRNWCRRTGPPTNAAQHCRTK